MIDKVRVNIYVSKDIKEQSSQLAQKLGISFSSLVNVALNEYVKQDEVKNLLTLFSQLRDLDIMQAKGEKPEA